MIWAPVSQGAELLASMHETMNQALQTAGWRSEARTFTGHVTVARIKTADLSDIIRRLPDDQPGVITAKELTLYQSQLTPAGPIYRRVMGFPFEHNP
jgi:2'-5' RNA ligase